jgi:dolichol-phosphate mannosyltransferase
MSSLMQMASTTAPGRVSFVIPFFNEKEVLPKLFTRLNRIRSSLNREVEFIFVDDGSTDAGSELVEQEAQQSSTYRLVVFSRNFGHQAAISAGLTLATGGYVCLLDADLQDPPELIEQMLQIAETGVDVVYGVRRTREASRRMQLSYKIYYRLLNLLADTDIAVDSGDFCLMSRTVVDTLLMLPEQQRFVRGLRSWVGFKQRPIEYSRPARAAGTSKYPLKSLVKLALDGIFSFSTKPLRLATYTGLILSTICLCYTVYAFAWRFLSGQSLPGFATLAVGVFFLGAVQLISIGILGEYIARIFYEVKRRPSYVIARTVNVRVI